MRPIISLTTDFGLRDSYVGEMKAVLLNGNPDTQVVDISHSIRPYDIYWGAFQLLRSYAYFPHGTIHIVVIDPGVGTKRKAIYVKTGKYHFIGPDNGVLLWAVQDCAKRTGIQVEVFEIASAPELCPTFHGRDVFAPFAISIIKNEIPQCRVLKSLTGKEFPGSRELDGVSRGEVVGYDNFGNVITSVGCGAMLKAEGQVGERFEKYQSASNYLSIAEDKIALIRGSHGFWEFAARKASAWEALRVKVGDEVTVYPVN